MKTLYLALFVMMIAPRAFAIDDPVSKVAGIIRQGKTSELSAMMAESVEKCVARFFGAREAKRNRCLLFTVVRVLCFIMILLRGSRQRGQKDRLVGVASRALALESSSGGGGSSCGAHCVQPSPQRPAPCSLTCLPWRPHARLPIFPTNLFWFPTPSTWFRIRRRSRFRCR